MRRLVHIFVFVTLLGFALSGCRQSAAERQLVEIDTLIAHGDYDSALAQLRAVDTTTLSRDELAYHGLLMTHAAYKAYADSICFDTTWIARARTAYADGGPYDRHIRTLLYSGCVAEGLGDPLTAMRWFKRTELEARKDDHYSRGFALMAMGQFYQNDFHDIEAINKYNQAVNHFSVTKDTNNLLYCNLQLCQLYSKSNIDSARIHANKVRSLATNPEHQMYITAITKSMEKYLFYEKNYSAAKDSALKILNNTDIAPFDVWLHLAICYVELGNMDSAQVYINNAPAPSSANDSILYYEYLAETSKAKNDLRHYSEYYEKSNDLAGETIIKSTENKLLNVENRTHNDYKSKNYDQSLLWVLFIVGIVMVSAFLIWVLNWRNNRKQKQEIKELQHVIDTLNQTIQELNATSSQETIPSQRGISKEIITNLTAAYRDILTRMRKEAGKKGKDSFDETVGKALTPGYFSNLHQYVDYAHHGLATSMKESEKLTDKEINIVCMRLCRLPNSIIATYVGLHALPNVTRLLNAIAAKYYGPDAKFSVFFQE